MLYNIYECETVIELKNHVINLFKYLDENRINIENKDELINNLNEIEDKIEKVGK